MHDMSTGVGSYDLAFLWPAAGYDELAHTELASAGLMTREYWKLGIRLWQLQFAVLFYSRAIPAEYELSTNWTAK